MMQHMVGWVLSKCNSFHGFHFRFRPLQYDAWGLTTSETAISSRPLMHTTWLNSPSHSE